MKHEEVCAWIRANVAVSDFIVLTEGCEEEPGWLPEMPWANGVYVYHCEDGGLEICEWGGGGWDFEACHGGWLGEAIAKIEEAEA